MRTIYQCGRVYTGETVLYGAFIVTENDQITGVYPQKPAEMDDTTNWVDWSAYAMAPAFIDLQIYGGNGHLFNNSPTVETIRATVEAARAGGSFAIQITLSCSPLATMWQAIDACRAYWAEGGEGLIGLHLEGPYFNPEKRGAHPLEHIRKPEAQEIKELLERGRGVISYITIAPEQFDDECLDLLLNSGIPVAAGHSNATFAQAARAFDRGITRVTHLFNAMSAFQSREPGLVGATYDRMPWASIIADGIHCDYNALKISKKILGNKLWLITDAVTESSAGDYQFKFTGDRFVDRNGTLSGSALTMWQAVQNVMMHAGIPLEEALRMASTYPAEVIGQGHRWGKIKAGYAAQMVVMDLAAPNRLRRITVVPTETPNRGRGPA